MGHLQFTTNKVCVGLLFNIQLILIRYNSMQFIVFGSILHQISANIHVIIYSTFQFVLCMKSYNLLFKYCCTSYMPDKNRFLTIYLDIS